MKQISNKEYEKYQQYQTDKLYGRILTPDGLRVVCAGLDNDPEKIGIHMLEMLTKFRRSGLPVFERRLITWKSIWKITSVRRMLPTGCISHRFSSRGAFR